MAVSALNTRLTSALAMCAGLSIHAPAQTTPVDPFYIPPSPLTAAAHGSVIRSRPLATAAALPHAARNLLVMYHSTAEDGHDVAVTGAVAIPSGDPPAGGWPVTTWTHGTTGIGPLCAPSLDTADGPEHQFLGMHEAVMDDYVKRGYVVLATDYEGLGPPGLHPFCREPPKPTALSTSFALPKRSIHASELATSSSGTRKEARPTCSPRPSVQGTCLR